MLSCTTSSLPEGTQSDRQINTLHYLNVRSSEVCQFPEMFKRQIDPHSQTAWLPDGRSLVVTDDDIVLHTPCQDTLDTIGDRFAGTILNVAAGRADSILLRGRTAYWLFDPVAQTVRRVDGVTPGGGPDDGWDVNSYAWSFDGNQVAIIAQGSPALHLVNVHTGQVARTIQLTDADDERAPIIEWLTHDQLMIWSHRERGPLLLRLDADDAQSVAVIPDIFGLDLDYPYDLWAIGAFGDPADSTVHIILAFNTSGENGIYVYHSETQTVEKLPFEPPTLLILPTGDTMRLSRPDAADLMNAPGVEVLQILWVDADRPATRLLVEGHLPRNYPDLHTVWWADRSRLVFSSSQGISLVSVPDGRVIAFWELDEVEDTAFPYALISPDGDHLVALAEYVKPGLPGLYGNLYLIETPD